MISPETPAQHAPATARPERPLLSVIVPCFNEQDVIRATHARLVEALGTLDADFELLYVNDGSADATAGLLDFIASRDKRVRVIHFSRNFGHQLAVSAGLEHAAGDAIAIIDADLQDPPECIGQMLERWRDGYDVVYGQRVSREGESAFKLATARLFYRGLNSLSDVEMPLDVGDFRLIDRAVAQAICAMPERDRFLRGMFAWAGFRQTALPYERHARAAGVTKYSLRKMVRLALDGVLSFSMQPLRLVMMLGFAIVALAALGIAYAVANRLMTDNWVSGWTLLFIAVMFMGGVQLVVMGMIGEYVGRIYMASKHRPLYLIARRTGFAQTGTAPVTGSARLPRAAA
jgi:polyisoprenyl-phosphate glycosyltransferase